jgi:hypothetical protein
MKYKIWKYPIDFNDALQDKPTTIRVPRESILLCAKNQYNNIVVYFQVPTEVEEQDIYQFFTLPTGFDTAFDDMLPLLTYLDTVLIKEGTIVWHGAIQMLPDEKEYHVYYMQLKTMEV